MTEPTESLMEIPAAEHLDIIMDENIHRLYKARVTMRTMMRARNYTPMQEPWDQSQEGFLNMYTSMSNYTALTVRAWKNEALLLAFFPLDPKLRVTVVRDVCDYAKECNCNHYIIVYAKAITAFTKSHIANYRADNGVRIETFAIDALQYNVTQHKLVPPHRVLGAEEQQQVLKKLRATTKQLAKILTSDPLVKWFGARPGQVMEITRASPDGFYYPFYRVVTKGTYKAK